MNRPVRFIFTNGKLVHQTITDEVVYATFKRSLQEGQLVEAYFDIVTNDKSLGQLNKVHKIIRDIATETGNDMAQLKRDVKKMAGLSYPLPNGTVKYLSFADCSRDELSKAIFVAEEMATEAGVFIH